MGRELVNEISCEGMPFDTTKLDGDLSRKFRIALGKLTRGDVSRSREILKLNWFILI